MKFNLNDFLQLDTNDLLAVNGGSGCSSGPSSGSSESSGGSSSSGNSSGASSGPGSSTTETIYVPTGPYNGYLVTRTKKGSNKVTSSGAVSSSGGGSCSSSYEGVGSASYQTGGSSSSGSHGCSGGGSSAPSGGNNVGGTCSAGTQTPPVENPNTEKTSGKFAQITDGSYADNLTMQFYKNLGTVKGMEYDLAMNDGKDQNGNVIDFLFSSSGCLMAGTAKIASEATGKNISLLDINEKCDINKDGLLDYEEISKGLQDILGEDFEVKTDYWQDYLSKEKFEDCAEKGDYVLARAKIDDVNRNNIRDDYHWIVLEGYTTDAQGRLCFTYDGTSDNDAGRKYVYGAEDLEKREFSIDKIITVHINKR